jgi:D-beta-D-heptose 7-phosphate kinase/D-beta-D-heptose 1-phosphate adenosyltransferase
VNPPLSHLFRDRRILVIGDVMLDRFVYGQVLRISPEAPVPVLSKQKEVAIPGGAANVARNIAALSGNAQLVGAVGVDEAGKIIGAILAKEDRITDRCITIAEMPTTEKVRFVANQQLMRVDHESISAIPLETVRPAIDTLLADADLIVLSDYAKGLMTPELIAHVIAAARTRGISVLVDPKARDLTRYNGASLLTPNRSEAEAATGIHIDSDESAAMAAATILKDSPDTCAVIITRSEKGMTVLARGQDVLHMPTLAQEIVDVSGAGDTVIATLALSLASGLGLADAAHLGNLAAGIAVGKRGTTTVDVQELDHALRTERVQDTENKVAQLDTAAARAAAWRAKGETVGFTNGVFDLIHPGHISLLSQAWGQCDRLVVGLNSDASVKRLKGPTRPVQDEISRAIVLASLTVVDMVVIFGEDTPLEAIKALRPDILVKGHDYTIENVVGAREVQSWGGKVVLADLTADQSTTRTIAKIEK